MLIEQALDFAPRDLVGRRTQNRLELPRFNPVVDGLFAHLENLCDF